MAARIIAVSLALLAALNGGCGTVANTVWFIPDEGGNRVYGGVRADWQGIERAASGSTGIWVSGEGVKDRERQIKTVLIHTLDLPFSAVGDTLTLPYTLAARGGLIGRWSGQRTARPKATDEPACGRTPSGGEPEQTNVLAQLADNKFTSWTLSRIEIPKAEPPPKVRMPDPMRFLERTDQPVAAAFYSFSGSHDALRVPPDVSRQIALTGRDPMSGVTMRLDLPGTERSECRLSLLPHGVAPADTKEP